MKLNAAPGRSPAIRARAARIRCHRATGWPARRTRWCFPGVVFGGTDAALDCLVGHVFDRGYEMATIVADLAGDGTLTVKVDEGKIARIDLGGRRAAHRGRGPAAAGPDARGSRTCATTSRPRSTAIRGRFPFLQASRDDRPTRRRPRMVLEQESEAGRRWRTVDQPRQPTSGAGGRWMAGR